MLTLTNGKATMAQVLLPIALIALVLFLTMAFQLSQVIRDRGMLNQAMNQQAQPLENATKIETQLNALALGTLKLSEQGDKSAKEIIDRMKQLGITVKPPAVGSAPGTPPKAEIAPVSAPADAAPGAPEPLTPPAN